MNNQIVITWSEAQQEAERLRLNQELRAKEKFQEFIDSDIGMMDARDIGYYSEATGIDPNELRKMHSCNDIQSLMFSYQNDGTDDIISIY